MGRVFSYQEVEKGQVPELAAFERASSLFVELAESEVDKGYVDGSFIYGSVALGVANRRSDFDTFLSLADDDHRNYEAAKSIIQTVVSETGRSVPILPIVQTKEALSCGRHEIDRFFGQHLTSAYRIVQGNDPAAYISFSGQPADEILGTYLFQKKRRLANTYTSTDPLDVAEGGIQRMLELPPAIGRKALQALTEMGLMPEAVEKSADKLAVVYKSRELFEAHGIADGFNNLVKANTEYDSLLTDTLQGRTDKETYEDTLKSLHAKLPYAINWIEQVELALLKPELSHSSQYQIPRLPLQ
jgi:hypothetical protein